MHHPPSLLDPTFVYVPAVETDIRKTFARVRREQLRIVNPAGVKDRTERPDVGQEEPR